MVTSSVLLLCVFSSFSGICMYIINIYVLIYCIIIQCTVM